MQFSFSSLALQTRRSKSNRFATDCIANKARVGSSISAYFVKNRTYNPNTLTEDGDDMIEREETPNSGKLLILRSKNRLISLLNGKWTTSFWMDLVHQSSYCLIQPLLHRKRVIQSLYTWKSRFGKHQPFSELQSQPTPLALLSSCTNFLRFALLDTIAAVDINDYQETVTFEKRKLVHSPSALNLALRVDMRCKITSKCL